MISGPMWIQIVGGAVTRAITGFIGGVTAGYIGGYYPPVARISTIELVADLRKSLDRLAPGNYGQLCHVAISMISSSIEGGIGSFRSRRLSR